MQKFTTEDGFAVTFSPAFVLIQCRHQIKYIFPKAQTAKDMSSIQVRLNSCVSSFFFLVLIALQMEKNPKWLTAV